MGLIVQKFGGTSVADTEKIRSAARKAIRTQKNGHQVVMVVSAMGKNTDQLVDLARQVNEKPPAREMDMLLSTGEQVSVALMAMAIDALGSRGVSLTGAQIGIKTDAIHTKARIRSISTQRMRELLEDGNIVIAAGFQGIDESFNITTLGRGGSDTTAVALAAVLGAEMCEIYTDVDGVYTTDPRQLPEARCLTCISYDEMLELASLGAGVMHSRSIEFAKKYDVPIQVRNSFSDIPGTLIGRHAASSSLPVCGATLTRDEALINVSHVPDKPGTSLEIFSAVARRNVTIDMIVQNVGREGRANISFTVPASELDVALQAVQESTQRMQGAIVTHNRSVSKVSAVGMGMRDQIGVAARMFRALADAGINIQMITTSEIKISVLVDRDQGLSALRTVHQAFELDHPHAADCTETRTPAETAQPTVDARVPADVVERLRASDMEELVIDGVDLDETQARVSVLGIPDTPGVAARIFSALAQHDIFVDMIVQSHADHGSASLSFTVPRDKLTYGKRVTQTAVESMGCETILTQDKIAKLSVSGIGLRSHTGVAIRMFRALAERQINVEMINTSEVRVNVIVEPQMAPQALHAFKIAFADVFV